ncbi:Nramp family divalent metal transporter [Planctomycetota bacterium]
MAIPNIMRRIGPAFIVGATVIGPGSVTLMSTTGAKYGYSLIWLSLASGTLMAGFLALFMRFGIYCDDTFLGLTAKKLGRWYAVLCGIAIFLICAAFQFGNALGVTAGTEALVGSVSPYVWPVAFTVAAVVFLFGFKTIYFVLEKMMVFFLLLMAVAFLASLVWAGPNLPAVLRGACIPSVPKDVNWVTIGGLVATTFIIASAFFQSYLVKAKGWTEKDLGKGIADTVMASIVLTLIGAMIMITAAAALYPHEGDVNFGVMISQLETAFGTYAKLIFGVGFWAAAFSSFITNSLAGGVMLSDGLGLGGKINSTSTKVLATAVLLIGMTTSLLIIRNDQKAQALADQAVGAPAETPQGRKTIDLKVAAIRVGQASTMLAVPLGAIAMVVVLFDRRAVKGHGLGLAAKAFVLFGCAVLLGLAARTFVTIKPELMMILGLD